MEPLFSQELGGWLNRTQTMLCLILLGMISYCSRMGQMGPLQDQERRDGVRAEELIELQ